MPVLPPTSNPNFPSLDSILNNVRVICNDAFAGATSTPGEGQILTNVVPGGSVNNPFLLNHLNSAIRELYRQLRITGAGVIIGDNFVLEGLPPVDGPLGPSIPDPTIQTFLDYGQYWDGLTSWPAFNLPSNMIRPIRLLERTTGTTDTFMEMNQVVNGLPARNQLSRLQEWEWREGRINFVGALQPRDIRIRYVMMLPTFFASNLAFGSTYVPVVDCDDFVAYKTASKVSLSMGGSPEIAAALDAQAEKFMFQLKNERVLNMQEADRYRRRPYDDSDTALELDVYGI